MSKSENCPQGCKHVTFHYCGAAGTHCDEHCVCPCSPCEEARKASGQVDPDFGDDPLIKY